MSISTKVQGVVERVIQADVPVLKRVKRETIEAYLFALPYLLLFGVFLVYPLLRGGYMSLFDWNPLAPGESEFIGLGNYAEIISDPLFWTTFKNTLYFVVLAVPSIVVLALALALGVYRIKRGTTVLRAVFFSPYVLTVSVVAIVWTQFLATSYGPLNHYLEFLVSSPPSWLSSYLFAMPALVVTTIWWQLGFAFILLIAARQNISETLYEAARLDGAGTWAAFRDITLPRMRNALLFVVIVEFVLMFQVFGQPYIMTSGGPGRSTTTMMMYLYESAFGQQRYGYAAAIGYVITAILVIVSFINFYVIGDDTDV